MLISLLWRFLRPRSSAGLLAGVLLLALASTVALAALLLGASYVIGVGLAAVAAVEVNPVEAVGIGVAFFFAVYAVGAAMSTR